jgi:hypothetical protein
MAQKHDTHEEDDNEDVDLKSVMRYLKQQGKQNERILDCLQGDALSGKKGLIHVVSDLNDTCQITRKQVEEHAVKLKAHETEIAEGKSQRKTLITLLSLGSGGFGAVVTKFFGNNN